MLAYCFQGPTDIHRPTDIHGTLWLKGTKTLSFLLGEADLRRQNQGKGRGERYEES